MDAGRHRRALALFDAAADAPEADREALLAAAGRGPETLDAARRLLRADAAATVHLPSAPPNLAPAPEQPPPERIGVYRLTERIGRGGMGDVYRGERGDGLFEQRVAVKLMRPGLLPQASAAFFVTERRALARVKHRGIAQIFDGGVDAQGRPYLVMELLDGTPVDERLRGAGARCVARVVAEVCRAVQHAHQQLIVHADLKPSNILVDAEDQPKLLDFGVAQLLAEPGGAAPFGFPVTPRYASPERLAGARPAPADDVYALGVLLHELLAGAAWPEGDVRPPLADRDLEAVVSRATAAAPDARYGSAAALGDDLERWLARRPVSARPQTAGYVLRRFVQRRPRATVAAAAAVLGLAAALATITVLYLQAQTARAAAERRYADVRGMAKYLLFDVYDRLDRAPRTLEVRRDLARVGQGYLDGLGADPGAPYAVRLEAVQGLLRLATVQGLSGGRHLGETGQARANLDRAAKLGAALARDHPDRPEPALAAAEAHLGRALLFTTVEQDLPAADRAFGEAATWLARAERLDVASPELARLRVEAALRLADHRGWQSRYPEAVVEARRALALAERLPGPDALRFQARAYDVWAENLFYAGDERGSEPLYRRARTLVDVWRAQAPDDPARRHAAARADAQLGTTLISLGRGADALPVLERGARLAAENIAFDPQNQEAVRSLRILNRARAQALGAVGRHGEAVALMRAAVAERDAHRRAAGTPDAARDHAIAVAGLGDIYRDAGRKAEACATYREADTLFAAIARRGDLAALDQDYGRRLLRESAAASRCPLP